MFSTIFIIELFNSIYSKNVSSVKAKVKLNTTVTVF